MSFFVLDCTLRDGGYYNNWDFNALCTIFENLTGRGVFEEFEDRLAGPLGMQEFVRTGHTRYVTGADSVHPAYPFQLSARDLARFGLLFARGGEWQGRQIIPRSWVVESTQSYSQTGSKGGYGYMWWTATKEHHIPGVELPAGAFSARGYRGHKVLPYCPQTGTSYSSHEVALGYKEVEEPSVYVKFRLTGDNASILAWTTTPWTLPGNVGLAVGPEVTYVRVRVSEEASSWDGSGGANVGEPRLRRPALHSRNAGACRPAAVDDRRPVDRNRD